MLDECCSTTQNTDDNYWINKIETIVKSKENVYLDKKADKCYVYFPKI